MPRDLAVNHVLAHCPPGLGAPSAERHPLPPWFMTIQARGCGAVVWWVMQDKEPSDAGGWAPGGCVRCGQRAWAWPLVPPAPAMLGRIEVSGRRVPCLCDSVSQQTRGGVGREGSLRPLCFPLAWGQGDTWASPQLQLEGRSCRPHTSNGTVTLHKRGSQVTIPCVTLAWGCRLVRPGRSLGALFLRGPPVPGQPPSAAPRGENPNRMGHQFFPTYLYC